jgi:hypothetical protein
VSRSKQPQSSPSQSNAGTEEADEQQREEQQRQTVIDVWRTAFGGLVAAGVALAFTLGVGRVSAYEVPKLLEPFIGTLQYFCSAMCTASGTIVALMLTALGLSAQSQRRFAEFHYRRLRFIAWMATTVFVMAALLLLLIGVPLERADRIPRSFHAYVYYTVTIYSAVLCGVVVSTVLMLYRTVAETIEAVGLDTNADHYLVRDEDD